MGCGQDSQLDSYKTRVKEGTRKIGMPRWQSKLSGFAHDLEERKDERPCKRYAQEET